MPHANPYVFITLLVLGLIFAVLEIIEIHYNIRLDKKIEKSFQSAKKSPMDLAIMGLSQQLEQDIYNAHPINSSEFDKHYVDYYTENKKLKKKSKKKSKKKPKKKSKK